MITTQGHRPLPSLFKSLIKLLLVSTSNNDQRSLSALASLDSLKTDRALKEMNQTLSDTRSRKRIHLEDRCDDKILDLIRT